MGALVTIIINAGRFLLFTYAGKIIVSVIAAFGLTVATQKFVMSPFLDYIRNMMQGGPSGEFGAYAMQWMGILRIDQACSMLLSAWVTVQGIKAGKVFLGKVAS